ncbi:GspH/FimT family pseudopilin [Aquabacterium sp.]|uniref:GspH/FimT family pseudopilin n=1 Tax=Aquabacterium sp. TaxID=1872578 RepID=UPI0035B2DFF0
MQNSSMNSYPLLRRQISQGGFTLIELLMTMVVLVVLLAIGAPQLQIFLVKRTAVVQAESLAHALRVARSEAIKRGQKVTICNSANPEGATKTCATTSTDWSSGWLVFVDTGTNAKAFDSGETLLAVQAAFTNSGGLTLSSSKPAITFAPNGLAIGDNASFRSKPNLSGTAADAAKLNRCVKLAISGRVKIEEGTCS